MVRLLARGALVVVAALAAASVFVSVGARTASDLASGLPPEVRVGVAVAAAASAAGLAPLYLAFRLLWAAGDRKPDRPVTTLATLAVWNAAILGVLVGAMPDSTARALRSDGTWFLAGREVPAVRELARWAAGARRRGAVEPDPGVRRARAPTRSPTTRPPPTRCPARPR